MPRFRGLVRRPNKDHLIEVKSFELAPFVAPLTTPPVWDSRTNGWVGPVKDQGQCGSCWCFSGTGVCEIALAVAGKPGIVLSEEYSLDCGSNGGCNGDDNTTILEVAQSRGLPLSSDYGPYTAGGGTCKWTASQQLYKIGSWGFADSGSGSGVTPTDDIKARIMTNGCVGAAIAADDAFESWGDSNPSMSSPFTGSGSTDIDHDIILIGWDDSINAWILRNSWGSGWGVGGYMAISYGANLVGTEAVWAAA